MSNRRARALLVAGIVLALGGCNAAATASPAPTTGAGGGPAAPWPARSNAMDLARQAGLEPETSEGLAYHVHAHLDIFLDGKPIEVPAGIGINAKDPGVKTFPEADGTVTIGGIEAPCTTPCISPLHTHGAHGVLHTESATPKANTLGQFFIEWGVKLGADCVGDHCAPEQLAFYVNGAKFTGDPTTIELADRTEIAIAIGTPPAVIPSTADFDAP
jgi:hypothetical protein